MEREMVRREREREREAEADSLTPLSKSITIH